MRDTCKPVRIAFYNCLNGNLGTYLGSAVKVYDEKKKVGDTGAVYVLLSTQQETPKDQNDCAFITLSSIDVEVISKTGFEVTKDIIDDIANIILTLVTPTTQQSGLVTPSGFQFTELKLIRTVSRNVSITDSESILTKILSFSLEIVEQY